MAKKTGRLKYYESVGRRKSSVARVRLYIATGNKEVVIASDDLKLKKGDIYINKKPIGEYFPLVSEKIRYEKPLTLTDCLDRFAISIHVEGGGKHGQLDAVIHGVSRALSSVDQSYRLTLRREELLTRDPRVRERRKVGTGGRARRQKQSPKR